MSDSEVWPLKLTPSPDDPPEDEAYKIISSVHYIYSNKLYY